MTDKKTELETTYFEEPGAKNTQKCFELVDRRLGDLDIGCLIVASTTGKTGCRAIDFFEDRDIEVVVVTHQYGFREDNEIELKDEYRETIENSGNASLVITPDVLTRVPKIARRKYQGYSTLDIIADTLRIFSEGMKVCIECAVQAADSGNAPAGEEIAAIAGTGHGADTALILEGQHSHKLLDININEIVCMPRG